MRYNIPKIILTLIALALMLFVLDWKAVLGIMLLHIEFPNAWNKL